MKIGLLGYGRMGKAIEKIGAHLFKDDEDGKVVYKIIKKDCVNDECSKQKIL